VVKKQNLAEIILQNLTDQYLYKDVLVWKDLRKPDLLDKLLKLLAFQVGSEVSLHELGKQLNVKSETVANYIDLLEKSFVIYRLKSYSTNARKEVSKSSKVFFWDNGVRNTIIGDYRDLSMRSDQGMLFENFIISERMKMNSWRNLKIKPYFWRNYNQSEVDYIEEKNQTLYAFEIKYNTTKQFKITKAFTNMYPNASTKVITPINMSEFIL
jgi:predicted AAA+ superfamily ATPase